MTHPKGARLNNAAGTAMPEEVSHETLAYSEYQNIVRKIETTTNNNTNIIVILMLISDAT